MIGGPFKSTCRLALVAAAGLFAGSVGPPAMAADLSDDCCADLEERVAELEATTVRKGNRKVSVKLSGQVNKALLYWNDGDLSGVYVVDNIQSSTRLRLSGSAKISADYSAGFYIEFEMDTASSNTVNQYSGRSIGAGTTVFGGLQLRQAYWYIKSDHLGKIAVGRNNSAAKNITLIGLGSQSEAAYHQVLWGDGMLVRNSGTTGHQSLNTGDFGNFFFGSSLSRRELIRYDSPGWSGFTFSASWGDDDVWDVALRYAGEFGGVRIASGIGFEYDGWENCGLVNHKVGNPVAGLPRTVAGACTPPATFKGDREDKIWVANLSLLHVPTGLFATFAYYNRKRDGSLDQKMINGVLVSPEGDQWSIHAGIFQKFFALGKTTLYGEYIEGNDALQGAGGAGFSLAGTISSSKGTVWGLGIVQNIDAAAMNMYLAYRHIDVDVTAINGGVTTSGNYDGLDVVLMGARINF